LGNQFTVCDRAAPFRWKSAANQTLSRGDSTSAASSPPVRRLRRWTP